jgi:hypothetical protein
VDVRSSSIDSSAGCSFGGDKIRVRFPDYCEDHKCRTYLFVLERHSDGIQMIPARLLQYCSYYAIYNIHARYVRRSYLLQYIEPENLLPTVLLHTAVRKDIPGDDEGVDLADLRQ